MKKLMMTVVLAAVAALELSAMPTEAELEREEPAVKRLLASEHAALASGKMTRTEVASSAMDLAEKADTEAAKLLLMKGAFVLYVRDGNLDKAVETMNKLESAIADMPPEYVENMVELSLLGVSKKEDGTRLRRLLGEAKNAVKWTYEVVDGAIVLGGNGRTAVPKTTAGALVIPPVIDGKPVRGIGNDAFKRCDGLTSVTIPANVRTVGNGAFSGCCRLMSVTFPAELARIGGYAFWDCKELKEVSISSKWIGDHAFGACSKLASVLLSINVEGIGSGAFAYCGELKQINVEPGNRVFISVDGVLYTKDRKELVVCPGGLASVTIPSYVSTVRDSAFIGCERLKQIDVDPDNGGYSSIDGMLFTKNKETLVAFPCGRTSAEIPWGTTTIGNNAFSRNSLLTSVTIPSSVTNFIGFHAFSSCHKLKEMTIPARIGWGAFDCAGLESVTILSSAQSIGDCAFLHCGNLKTVTIKEGVSSIGGSAFAGCGSLKTVTIPASVTNIVANAFGVCGALTSVTMCGERPNAPDNVFRECGKLKAIHVPANAKSWAGMKEWQGIPLVFDAKLQVTKDRTTVQSIIDGMIKVPGRDYWLSETELTQGQWEAVMGYNLSAHKGANLPVENVSHDDCGVFLERLNQTKEARSSQFVFSIPTYDEWGYAAQAGGSGNECWIKPGVVGNILEMAWVKENCSNQTHAVATKVPNAFGFYDMLGNVWEWMSGRDGSGHVRIRGRGITDSVDIGWGWFIGRYVWFGNSNVRRENIGLRLAARIRPENGVSTVRPRLGSRLLSRRNEPKAAGQQQETVDGYTWSYQEKDGDATICAVSPQPTGTVSIPATLKGLLVTGIGDKVFEGCRAMNSVAIPASVKTIGEKAFADCGRLTSLSIPRCVTSIGSWAFANCGGFKSVSLPEGLTEIKRGAFYGTEITSVCIPPNVTSIEPAFVRCYGLKTVTIPASVTNIAECAFGVCTSLESIYVDSGNHCYRSLNGMVCSKDGLNLVAGVNGEVTIPDGVTNIGPGTFGSLGGLKSLTIPASVTNISERAFQYVHYGCGNLTSVTMLGERPNAPDNVFRGCNKLKSIHVPANAESWAGMKEWQGIPLVFDAKTK